MKDKAKIALKRFTSGLMAVLLAVCLVGTPKAKAVVTEGALLGSIFGSLLVSMGFSWAADNMDVPTFGESIYKLIQEFDDANKETGVQLIRDLNIAALTSGRPGTIQFNYAWTQAARSFAAWFSEKFFVDNNTSVVLSESECYLTLADGGRFDVCVATVNENGSVQSWTDSTVFKAGDSFEFSNGARIVYNSDTDLFSLYGKDNTKISSFYAQNHLFRLCVYNEPYTLNGSTYYCAVGMHPAGNLGALIPHLTMNKDYFNLIFEGLTNNTFALTAEKPAEVHYPDVAEDGSQVYEVTYQGVTATDIEGIIQGAVDRILAGTAAIAGSVEQAGTAEEVTNPEIEPYKVALTSVFPFCIPFDIYNMVTMFVAEPEAPHAEWTFELPWSSQEYSVGWDLSDFDGVAQVCRSMELVLFAVGLAVITYKVIKW